MFCWKHNCKVIVLLHNGDVFLIYVNDNDGHKYINTENISTSLPDNIFLFYQNGFIPSLTKRDSG